jgi:hypothetical protein
VVYYVCRSRHSGCHLHQGIPFGLNADLQWNDCMLFHCLFCGQAYFVQVVWLSIRYLREEKIRKARQECQPKVIFLDASSSSHDAAESTIFMFDNEGGLIKVVLYLSFCNHYGN